MTEPGGESSAGELLNVIDIVNPDLANLPLPVFTPDGSVTSRKSSASARARREAEARELKLKQLKRRCEIKSKLLEQEQASRQAEQRLQMELEVDQAQEELELAEFNADTVSEFDSCESSFAEITPIVKPKSVRLLDHAKTPVVNLSTPDELSPVRSPLGPTSFLNHNKVNAIHGPLAPGQSLGHAGSPYACPAQIGECSSFPAKQADDMGAGPFGMSPLNQALKPQCLSTETNAPDFYVFAQTIKQGLNLPRLSVTEFDGNPLNYHKFINDFDRQINKGYLSNAEKLGYLYDFCTGDAKTNILESKSLPPEVGYKDALDILYDRHGRLDLVVRAHMDRLTNRPQLRDDDFKGIRGFRAQAAESYKLFSQWNCQYTMDLPQNIEAVVQRLPQGAIKRFIGKSSQLRLQRKTVTFRVLLDILERLAEDTLSPLMRFVSDDSRSRTPSNARRNQATRVATAFSTVTDMESSESPRNNDYSTSTQACPDCHGRHSLWKCDRFKQRTVNDRHSLVRRSRLCYNCLRPDHCVGDCGSQSVCRIGECGRRHHTLLHWANAQDHGQHGGEDNGAGVAGTSAAILRSSRVRLKVVPVTVFDEDMKPHQTHAFLDEGSDTSLCTDSLARKLGLQGTDGDLTIATLNGTRKLRSRKVSLDVQGMNENARFSMTNVMVVPSLPNLQGSIPTVNDVHRYKHVRDLNFPVIDCLNVDLLVAADVLDAHEQHNIVRGAPGDPVAVHTGLGWCLFGPEEKFNDDQAVINFMHANTELHCQLERMYGDDFQHKSPAEIGLSLEDKRALSTMEGSVIKVDGHYQIGLPWKSAHTKLPYNRSMAEKRLLHLKRRFEKDTVLFEKYKEKVEGYVTQGFARKMPPNCLARSDRTWYIPHHATGNKFRVVFDCAASYKGTSLNDNLLQGPDLTNNLVGVLLRFRQERVAFAADVKGMFHQVRVFPQDCDSLRFLWWPNNDMNLPPVDYQMLVHLFGATSSPSCASFALRKAAQDQRHLFSPGTVRTVLTNFYVDDCLKSVPSTDEAVELIQDVTRILRGGGFCLTKFLSNSSAVLKSVPEDDRLSALLDLDLSNLPIERALGVQWDMEGDVFGFFVQIREKPLSRRGMLSMISQVYDPLGFIGPFLLPMKRLMQSLCNQKLGWDDPLPSSAVEQWGRWLEHVPSLHDVTISRCFKPSDTVIVTTELHCFGDACEDGYGAVCYLRFVDSEENIHCTLVLGKSRVTPLKPITIPRLELVAAVTAVKLGTMIIQELDYDVDNVFFWSDSTTVLHYIANTSRRFQTFVANRLAIIHEHSLASQWRHVGSKDNPADIASRGLMPDELNKSGQWFNGPDFLWKSEQDWPDQPSVLATSDENLEFKKEHIICAVKRTVGDTALSKLLSRYSTWTKLQKSIAWLSRFCKCVRWKYGRKADANDKNDAPRFHPQGLTVNELEEATKYIIRFVQREVFSAEFVHLPDCNSFEEGLQHGRTVSYRSPLHNLYPCLVNGLIHVGGRLQRSNLGEEQKFQIILPYRHPVTDLIVSHYHCTEGHSGMLHVLASVRERYWVVKGHSAVRRVVRQCMNCKLRHAKPGSQIMGALPKQRITPGNSPFTSVGVDYMAPFLVKVGRSQVKRYGCVFTCMCTRAVHIEVAHSLDTSSFINAFRRFSNRRGSPADIFSDNGTNFVGAQRELREGLARWNLRQIHDHLLQLGANWHFNPPAASHQGGIWERVIRSVRRILQAVIGNASLNDESLVTFLTEVERVLNNRPIAAIGDDSRDLKALTPRMLLVGKLDCSLPPDEFATADGYRKSWRTVQWLADMFWKRWLRDYLPILQLRQKWRQPIKNFGVGDLVLVVDEMNPRGAWPKGIVEEVYPDQEGAVRRVRVRTAKSVYMRDVRKLCLLEAV